MIQIIFVLFTAAVLAEAGLYCFIENRGRQVEPQKSDVLLVLGCRLHGSKPSPSLKLRLDKALELYREGYGAIILVSGGQGPDEIMPEAQMMKKYLTENGIPINKILTEEHSTSTWENIKYSKEIMDQRGLETAMVVTNDFHIYRSISMAKKAGIPAAGAAAPSVPHLKKGYMFRETLAVMKYWLLGN
jgi:uncharacterized SAM-binding protein YcdF (DUF218 family)